MQEEADKRLVKRILDGDQPSFDAFFRSYYPRLYRFALVRLDNDRDLADETAQIVLCQALSKMDTYRGEAPLFSWLCTFCRYEVSKQRKARHRAQGDKPLAEDDPAVKAALDSLLAQSSADPDAALYQSEIRRLIKVALDYLPSMYADILEAKYVRDMSVNQIADMFGKSPKATESILTRARSAFRDAFKTLMNEERALGGNDDQVSSLLEY
jgi:RNA polymerase sigma-70 factor (ECF subfamily)